MASASKGWLKSRVGLGGVQTGLASQAARRPPPMSHAALDAAGTDRAVEYLRCLLIRYGVLPTRDRRLADFQCWAAAKLDGIGNAGRTASSSNGFSGGICCGTFDPAAPPQRRSATAPTSGQAAPHRGGRLLGLAGQPRTPARRMHPARP